MALSTEVQDRVKTYLWEVAAYLSTMSPASRIEVLRDLESHLYESLNARSTTPTITDVDAVLSAMPAPASYGNEDNLTPARTNTNRITWNELPGIFIAWCRTIAWESFVGIALLIIGMWASVLGLIYMAYAHYFVELYYAFDYCPWPFSSAGGATEFFIGFDILLLGVICLVITVFIGKNGLRRVINANGTLHGFLGAFIAFLTPRLLLYNGLVFLLFCMGMSGGSISHKFFMLILILLPFSLIIMYLDYLLIKYEWRHQRKGLTIAVASSS